MFLTREGWDADDTEFWGEMEAVFARMEGDRGHAETEAMRENYAQMFEDFRENDKALAQGKKTWIVDTQDKPTEAEPLPWAYAPRSFQRGGDANFGWRAPRRLDKRGVGAGKTEELLKEAVRILRHIDDDRVQSASGLLAEPDAPVGDRVYFMVQNHELAAEIEERARRHIGNLPIDLMVWRGFEQIDPESGLPMCRRVLDVKAALASSAERSAW